MPIAYLMKVSTGLGSHLGLEGHALYFQGNKTAKQKDPALGAQWK